MGSELHLLQYYIGVCQNHYRNRRGGGGGYHSLTCLEDNDMYCDFACYMFDKILNWILNWIFFSIIQRSIEFLMSIAQCYSPPIHVQHFFIISLQSSAAGISTPTSSFPASVFHFLDIATLLQRTHMPNIILPIVTFLESFQTLITKMYIYFIQNIKL